MLAELGEGPGHHDFVARVGPSILIEAADSPPSGLGGARTPGGQNFRQALLVVKQTRLLSHHPMLGRRVHDAINADRRRPPLAEAPMAGATIALRTVAPEQDVLLRSARVVTSERGCEPIFGPHLILRSSAPPAGSTERPSWCNGPC